MDPGIKGKKALAEAEAVRIRGDFGVQVTSAAADVTRRAGQVAIIAVAGDVDILANNAGAAPPGSCREWDRDDFQAGPDADMHTLTELIRALLPGIHATDRAASLDARVVAKEGISVNKARARRCTTLPVGRYGTAAEFDATCAFSCSAHSGFTVGQNILPDGGAINATL